MYEKFVYNTTNHNIKLYYFQGKQDNFILEIEFFKLSIIIRKSTLFTFIYKKKIYHPP